MPSLFLRTITRTAPKLRNQSSIPFRSTISTFPSFKMPETLTSSEVHSGTDTSVSKQYDSTSTPETKFQEFYDIADKLKIGLFGTYRPSIGPVARSMAVAKRTGPDFLFLSNKDSKKFEDLEKHPEASITFQNSRTQDWVSITGEVKVANNSDPRIKEVWSRGASVWFGDLGDGKHNGSADDPRMALIEVQAKYIVYWKHEVGTLGFAKEVVGAAITGGVANTGVLREMNEQEIKTAREKDSAMSS